MSNRNAQRITDLLSISNIEVEDLLEIVDKDGDQNGNPVSRQVSIDDLYTFLLNYDADTLRQAQERFVRVDDSFPDNQGPTFNSLELAVDYSRGIINTSGGKVLIVLYFDSNGNGLSTNLTSYSWYSSDPADSDIILYSALIGGNDSNPDRFLRVDASYEYNKSPTFKSTEEAYKHARDIISNNGGEVLIEFYYDSNGSPLDTDISSYGWYSQQSEDDSIILHSRAYQDYNSYLRKTLIEGIYNDSEAPFNLDDSKLPITLNL